MVKLSPALSGCSLPSLSLKIDLQRLTGHTLIFGSQCFRVLGNIFIKENQIMDSFSQRRSPAKAATSYQ
jgi:hypothetical protein